MPRLTRKQLETALDRMIAWAIDQNVPPPLCEDTRCGGCDDDCTPADCWRKWATKDVPA